MIRRSTSLLRQLMLTFLLALLALAGTSVSHAADVEVKSAKIESSEEGYRLAAVFSIELSDGLRKAIKEGIPVSFTTEIELTRSRWYWVDEKVVRSENTVKIAFNEWTQQYTVIVNNGLQQTFPSLDSALNLVLRPSRWLIAEKSLLTNGATYNVAVQLRMGLSKIPMHFQIPTFNDSNWSQKTEWKRFSFKADDK
ncbi:DUF4390 domain-containing protein [Undibacterium sp. CY18W]|uniref:DUF4390 domain-containing protein n=1 Tax=Undibacterium hunanense TaxID=2762292 RepID=A0ABR6ZLQ9_9BURK|nr:DUF4390 domain-containing protein [Undibacterium hunanense]MBC3916821.1 DUF4390 domain-containing protein [Undibacterium hunanense]